jgi:hypothetical protein
MQTIEFYEETHIKHVKRLITLALCTIYSNVKTILSQPIPNEIIQCVLYYYDQCECTVCCNLRILKRYNCADDLEEDDFTMLTCKTLGEDIVQYFHRSASMNTSVPIHNRIGSVCEIFEGNANYPSEIYYRCIRAGGQDVNGCTIFSQPLLCRGQVDNDCVISSQPLPCRGPVVDGCTISSQPLPCRGPVVDGCTISSQPLPCRGHICLFSQIRHAIQSSYKTFVKFFEFTSFGDYETIQKYHSVRYLSGSIPYWYTLTETFISESIVKSKYSHVPNKSFPLSFPDVRIMINILLQCAIMINSHAKKDKISYRTRHNSSTLWEHRGTLNDCIDTRDLSAKLVFLANHGRGKFTDHGRGKFTDHGRGKFTDHVRDKFTDHGRGKFTDHGRDKFTDHGRDKFTDHGRDKFTDTERGLTILYSRFDEEMLNQLYGTMKYRSGYRIDLMPENVFCMFFQLDFLATNLVDLVIKPSADTTEKETMFVTGRTINHVNLPFGCECIHDWNTSLENPETCRFSSGKTNSDNDIMNITKKMCPHAFIARNCCRYPSIFIENKNTYVRVVRKKYIIDEGKLSCLLVGMVECLDTDTIQKILDKGIERRMAYKWFWAIYRLSLSEPCVKPLLNMIKFKPSKLQARHRKEIERLDRVTPGLIEEMMLNPTMTL